MIELDSLINCLLMESDYVTRRFDASSAELKCSWGWTFVRTAGERDPLESAYETTIHPAVVAEN